MRELFEKVQAASRNLTMVSDDLIGKVLNEIADELLLHQKDILEANQKDLSRMDADNPLYDRLKLTEARIEGIAADTRHVATLQSPLNKILKHYTLPNGLDMTRVSVPFGVIGVIYEARPNVTVDVASLCLKSGNACLLKGGKDADDTNRILVQLIQVVLRRNGLNPDSVTLMPATHEATAELLTAVGYVDLVIPRGSSRLIQFVRDNAKVPVIETGAGICHCYFDEYGDVQKGKMIINNAKTRRVSVCNALDCLIVHAARQADLPMLCAPLQESNVLIYADEPSMMALSGSYPAHLLKEATSESFGTEFLSYTMAIKTVASMEEALEHIRKNSSKHSESIITEDSMCAEQFIRSVDAACVYTNAPTSFTDGAQFGLGAEIGISTQKLHARGPMALEELTTYKWVIRGDGQIRS